MRQFMFIWSGQFLSVLGTSITGFALGVWVFQQNGSATEFALINFWGLIAGLVVTPFAGSIADRYNRRLVMIFSDTGAALATLLIAVFLLTGTLQIWHIYVTMALRSACNAVQQPAYTASISLMVSTDDLSRAAGLTKLSEALSRSLYPVLGGFLIAAISLKGIIILDLVTYGLALIPLLLITFPKVSESAAKAAAKSSVWKDIGFGWSYIRARSGLLGLLAFSLASNFLMGVVMALGLPLVLSFSTSEVLGIILSTGAFGMILSSLAISIKGGPKKLMNGVFGAQVLLSISFLLLGLRPDPTLIGIGTFMFFLALPVAMTCNQAIWQRKVEPEVQGRVLAMRSTIGGLTLPLAFLIGGPLADHVFEPMLADGGLLVSSLGEMVGVGPGRGIGLLFMILGILLLVITLIGLALPPLRDLEKNLPDWAQTKENEQS